MLSMLSTLTSFAGWLTMHGGLVKGLAIPLLSCWRCITNNHEPHECERQSIMQTAVQELRTAMQLSAAGQSMHPAAAAVDSPEVALQALATTAAEAAAAPGAAGPQQEENQQQLLLPPPPPQQQPGLRLIHFSSSSAAAEELLPLVSAQTLTNLEVELGCNKGSFGDALQRMSSLQQLTLHCGYLGLWDTRGEVYNIMPAVGHLQLLTRLELTHVDGITAMDALQQLLAQSPQLRVLHLGIDTDGWHHGQRPSLDMSGLDRLQEFTCGALMDVAVLPTQLRRLDLGDTVTCVCRHIDVIMPLQQLIALHGAVHSDQQQPLLRLAQLPALQELHLFYYFLDCAAATAPTWQSLPQLCELKLKAGVKSRDVITQQQVAAVFLQD
jgi:hypothetical protein